MNEQLITVVCIFAAIVAVEALAVVLGWRKERRATRLLLGLALFQVALPAILGVLGLIWPPSFSHYGNRSGDLILLLQLLFAPLFETALLVIGIIMAVLIFVRMIRHRMA